MPSQTILSLCLTHKGLLSIMFGRILDFYNMSKTSYGPQDRLYKEYKSR